MTETDADVILVARSENALDETADRIKATRSDALAYPIHLT